MTKTKLKELREQRGLSQTALSDMSGIAQTTISAIERGASPGLMYSKRLADALGVKVDALLEDDETGRAFPKPRSSGRS